MASCLHARACRVLQQDVEQLRRQADENDRLSAAQQQRIEELTYRINSPSSPSSPFNPVFTPSPGPDHSQGDTLNRKKRILAATNGDEGGT